MLRADQIAELSHSSCGSKKIAELVFVIQRSGIPNDMIMDMRAVRMRTNDKGIVAFEKAAGLGVVGKDSLIERDLLIPVYLADEILLALGQEEVKAKILVGKVLAVRRFTI